MNRQNQGKQQGQKGRQREAPQPDTHEMATIPRSEVPSSDTFATEAHRLDKDLRARLLKVDTYLTTLEKGGSYRKEDKDVVQANMNHIIEHLEGALDDARNIQESCFSEEEKMTRREEKEQKEKEEEERSKEEAEAAAMKKIREQNACCSCM